MLIGTRKTYIWIFLVYFCHVIFITYCMSNTSCPFLCIECSMEFGQEFLDIHSSVSVQAVIFIDEERLSFWKINIFTFLRVFILMLFRSFVIFIPIICEYELVQLQLKKYLIRSIPTFLIREVDDEHRAGVAPPLPAAAAPRDPGQTLLQNKKVRGFYVNLSQIFS